MSFYGRVNKKSKSECWMWDGPTISGYGAYYLANKTYTAHHYAFTLHHGHKPKGIIRHSCKNSLCVNPMHLYDMGDPLFHFNYHANKKGKDDCWIWGGTIQSKGYGLIHTKMAHMYAHRVAFEIFIRPLKANEIVCHYCDNPACVNPSHLFAGKPADNSADMVSKNRQCRGETKKNSRLTEQDILELRQMRANGFAYSEIGRRFGISYTHAQGCAVGRYWKHLPLHQPINENRARAQRKRKRK